MSRVGKTPVAIPKGVTVNIQKNTVTVQGPKGEITVSLPRSASMSVRDESVCIENTGGLTANALHGMVRATLANAVKGVTEGWQKTLELSGVGYRATMNGTDLVLNLGFSHPVSIKPPEGVTFTIVEGKIVVSGIDKQLVGQTAADIRATKKPEPYKGKGIRYSGEYIRKKAGKAKAVAGAPAK